MTAPWGDLFERAAAHDVSEGDVRRALAERRDAKGEDPERDGGGRTSDDAPRDDAPRDDRPDPARVVADADVLAADLLVGGPARRALDQVREHSWVALVASDPLLDDAAAVVEALADGTLAADWRGRAAVGRVRAEHPEGDHPALASALAGNAAHVLSFDEGLRSAAAGVSLNRYVSVSVRHPDAFARVFDPEGLYAAVEGGEYPGPDRDPRE